MKILAFVFSFFLYFSSTTSIVGQAFGFQIPENQNAIKIPFQYINNFIVLDLKFNDQLPLKFIFDTGAENTLLTKRWVIDAFGITLGRTFSVLGSDLKTELKAHLAQGISLSTDRVRAANHDILVLDEDYINFEQLLGMQIHGIAAADLFKRLVIKIDYRSQELVLYRAKPNFAKKYEELDIEIIKSKPYIKTKTIVNDAVKLETKLLLDTGADMSLLLDVSSDKALKIPDHVISGNIGVGLGGFLEGYLGRIKAFAMGPYVFDNFVGSFQQRIDSIALRPINNRNGIIGNQILSRFTIMIDYQNEKLYLKPTRKWKREFKFDKSGFFFIITDISKNKIVVQNVIENTPAWEAGFQRGDIIKRVNGIRTVNMNLNTILNIMSRRVGKAVKIKYERNGETYVKIIVLRDIL